MICRLLAFVALLAVFVAPAGAAEPAPAADVRQAFMDALATAEVSPTPPPGGDEEALRAYVLYPYLQAARLRRQLELTAPAATGLADPTLPIDQQVAAFLATQGGAPVAMRLRTVWLTSLAARRSWAAYLGQFDAARDRQPVLQCQALAARVALEQTDGLVATLTELWLTPRALPEACDPALDWWRRRGGPDDELTERRARLALQAGESSLARYLARSLPDAAAAPLLQWAALIDQPAREVAALLTDPDRAVEDAALADGWQRFARGDAEAAAAQFPALVAARKFDARAASPYARAVALGLAWSRLPGALAFFAQVRSEDFDERTHEWHVRAALWAGDWKRAADAIAAMPEPLRTQARWQYWAARADEKLGEFARARAGYQQVIPTDNWYAALAAAHLDRKVKPTLEPLPISDAAITTLGERPGFQRARELLACRLEAEASAEWNAAFDELDAGLQRAAIGLAARWAWHHQAIAVAARQRVFNDYDLLYPRPYDFEVREASSRTGLPRSFIYAIIRQESLFRADAGSTAGALGLMQLMPDTARLVARRIGLPVPSRADLLLPSINVPLGSAYLADLVGRFDGETSLATAAYNAGPNAARRWLPSMPLDLDVWAENIPYNETRTYVQRVAWHALVFEWLDKREALDVSAWLRSIKPLAAPVAKQ